MSYKNFELERRNLSKKQTKRIRNQTKTIKSKKGIMFKANKSL